MQKKTKTKNKTNGKIFVLYLFMTSKGNNYTFIFNILLMIQI